MKHPETPQLSNGLDLSPWLDSFKNLTGIWTSGLQAVAQAQIDSWKLGQQQMGAGMEIFQSMLQQGHAASAHPKSN